MNKRDLLWATLGEGGLVLAVAAVGWATKQPLIFASLGPTAYELVEQPQLKSARLYNVIVGHFMGVAAGFLALYLTRAWATPGVTTSHLVVPARIFAATLAAGLTTFGALIFKASQPAAISTTFLISLGAMQTRRDAVAIILGVLIIASIGEPIRRLRLKQSQQNLRPALDPQAQ